MLQHLGVLEQENGYRVHLGLYELRRNNQLFRRGWRSWEYCGKIARTCLEPFLRHLGSLLLDSVCVLSFWLSALAASLRFRVLGPAQRPCPRCLLA